MSRIGKQPVVIPKGVKIAVANSTINVEGPKGKLNWAFRPEVTVRVDEATSQILVSRAGDSREERALHGLTRALIDNMVEGVTKGFEKKLEVVGVGYLGAISGKKLQLRLGFANEIHLDIPTGLTVTCPDQTHIVIQGVDKQLVGQFAAEIRSCRKPEPYKGKGVRYEGEVVRRKAGKAVTK
jgi:large subunit ribosomal protein L6